MPDSPEQSTGPAAPETPAAATPITEAPTTPVTAEPAAAASVEAPAVAVPPVIESKDVPKVTPEGAGDSGPTFVEPAPLEPVQGPKVVEPVATAGPTGYADGNHPESPASTSPTGLPSARQLQSEVSTGRQPNAPATATEVKPGRKGLMGKILGFFGR